MMESSFFIVKIITANRDSSLYSSRLAFSYAAHYTVYCSSVYLHIE